MDTLYLEDEIVLIAEQVERTAHSISQWDTTLEMAEFDYAQELVGALKTVARNVVIYPGPREFQDHIGRHAKSLVMTIYGGKESRNRMALVPAVCEAHGIAFMGADVYARVICQDKYLSKQYVSRLGLNTPNGLLIDEEQDLRFIETIKPPLVVKPNMEGSSIGIAATNLTSSYDHASELARTLLNRFHQPVLIEEFCPGREVSICVSGTTNEVYHCEAVEDIHKSEPNYFHSRLFTFDLKKQFFHQFDHRLVTADIPKGIFPLAIKAFKLLGKMDYLRIDGRLTPDGFTILELTPDCYIGTDGGFAASFILSGISYENSIRSLVTIARKGCRSPYANEP